jgi:hypothetical protein
VTSSDSELLMKVLIISVCDRTPCTGDQPVARPVPPQDVTAQQDEGKHSCLERDSKPRSQHASC